MEVKNIHYPDSFITECAYALIRQAAHKLGRPVPAICEINNKNPKAIKKLSNVTNGAKK